MIFSHMVSFYNTGGSLNSVISHDKGKKIEFVNKRKEPAVNITFF